VVGQAPLGATVTTIEQLRCNLCLEIFKAPLPADLGEKKYDESAASMMAILKYGTGVPFNRLDGLQRNLGIPLAASTQWDIVEHAAKLVRPAFQELVRQAAQGDVLHNDDTPVKILELMKKKEKKETKGDDG
jgi:transposase